MYRVQYKHPKEWVFVCKECLLTVKKNNPDSIKKNETPKLILYNEEALI